MGLHRMTDFRHLRLVLQSVIRDQERLLTAVLAALRSSQQVRVDGWWWWWLGGRYGEV